MITSETKLLLRALIDGHCAMAKSLERALRQIEDIEREKARWPDASSTKSLLQSQSRYANIAEAAELLNMTESALDELRLQGVGPPYRNFGQTVQYDIGELRIWTASRQHLKGARRPDSLCTIKEAGEILKISRSTLYLMIGQGKLPVLKIGKSSRIRRSDLNQLMQAPFSE